MTTVLLVSAVLWALAGLLGWGWFMHVIAKFSPEESSDPARWRVLAISPVLGPTMSIVVFLMCVEHGEFSIGLRFK